MRARIICVKGESKHLIEDFYLPPSFNGRRVKTAVGDWAHNLVGGPYKDNETVLTTGGNRRTKYNGGVIGAQLARRVIAGTDETGYKLVSLVNKKLAEKYAELAKNGYNLQDCRSNRAFAFAGYITHLIANPESMVVTTVGDVKLAAGGKIIAGKTKEVDTINAGLRKAYIEETGDVEGGFDHIKPKILEQFRHQNTPGHELSYPAIDGTETLEEGIEVVTLPTPEHVLIWSDGYVTPEEFTIEGLERKLSHVYKVDPFRCREYPAVSYLRDDRTAVELLFDDWTKLSVEEITPAMLR